MNESTSDNTPKNNKKTCFFGFRKKFTQWWHASHWYLLTLGIIFVIYLGYSGFKAYYLSVYETRSPLDILYRTLQLFVLGFDSTISNLSPKLEIARWLAPAIAAYTAAKALAVIFSEQLQLFRLRFMRKHIIICGLGNKGLLLAQKFRAIGKKVVVVEINEENDNIKECKDIGSIVVIGNARAPYILGRAGLNKAEYLFSVCGQDNINAEIAFQTRILLKSKKNKPLTCVVHIIDPQLCRLIKEREFDTEKNDTFRLEFLNLFDQAAHTLLKSYSPFDEKQAVSSLPPHVLIIGVGSLGESLVVHTAKKWNEMAVRDHKKFKISIIDRAAEKKKELFYIRYPGLEKVCEIIPLEMDISSPEFESGKLLFNSKGECSLTMVYICLDDDSFALSTALTLHQRFRKHDFPIVVRMNSETGLAELIQGEAHGLGRLHGFGILDRVFAPEILLRGTHEILARAIHEEYRQNQLAKGKAIESNPSLVLWDKLPETLRDSNRRQAAYLGAKLLAIGCYIVPMIDWNAEFIEFSPEEIEKMAEMEHEDWKEERLKDGWEYTSDKKDIKNKKTPFLVPWNALPEEEKEKDRNPVRKIPVILEKAGFQIYRVN